jgi:competence protein ComEA
MLEALPGIGPSKAESIIKYREENGPFTGIDGIMEVDGMGQSLFDDIKDMITVGD